MICDSGSANAWINSVECKQGDGQLCLKDEKELYDPSKSSTFLEVQNGWTGTVNFVSGSLKGKQVKDWMWIGEVEDQKEKGTSTLQLNSTAAPVDLQQNSGVVNGPLVSKDQIFNEVTGMSGPMFQETFTNGFGGIVGTSFIDMAADKVTKNYKIG